MRFLARLFLAAALAGAPLAGYAHGIAHALHDLLAPVAQTSAANDGACNPAQHSGHRDDGCAQCVAYAGIAFAATPAGGFALAVVTASAPIVSPAWAFSPAPYVPFASRGPPQS